MKFVFKNNLIYLPAILKYNHTLIRIPHCIIDSGSAGTTLDSDFVSLDLSKPTKIRRLVSIGGYEEVIEQQVDSLEVCNTKINHIKIQFGNLKSEYGINGFIGNDFLSNFKVTIDYN